MASTDFHFRINETPNFLYKITDNIILNIIKLTHGYSLLYFTDGINNKIPVPNNIKVSEYEKINNMYIIILNSINKDFFHLYFHNNYKIEYDNIEILDIKSNSSNS
jgi:hypothetical protein